MSDNERGVSPIVALHDENGVIKRTDLDNGIYPEDGVTDRNGHIIHRIYECAGNVALEEFVNTHVWDDELDEWLTVDRRPNYHSFWDRSVTPAKWTWDIEVIKGEIRAQRDIKLLHTDWAMLPDAPLSAEKRQQYIDYRQALRDITDTVDLNVVDSADKVVWPEEV